MDDDFFMKQAYKEALKAFDNNEVPVGAIIVANQKIISKGFNQVEMLNDNTAHAEIIALTAAFINLGSKILEDCTLYVTIEPCAMCAGALKWARIGTLVYAASEPKSGFSNYKPSLLHKSTIVKMGIMERECAELMKNFFAKKRNLN